MGPRRWTRSVTPLPVSDIQSRDRELELLATFLREPQQLKACVLSPEHFGYAENRAIFSAMRSLQDDAVLSLVDVKAELDKQGVDVSVPYLFSLTALEPESVDPIHVRELTNRIQEAHSRVGAIHRTMRELDLLKDPAVPYAEALNLKAATVVAGQQSLLTNSSPVISDIIRMDQSNTFGRRFYYGQGLFKPMNNATKGFREGQVVVINAGYKAQKTRWMLNLVIAFLEAGVSVSVQTLEDNAGAIKEKLVAMLTCLHEQEVELYYDPDGPLELKKRLKPQIDEAEDWLSGKPLRIYDMRHNVYDWKSLPFRIMSDRMQYGGDKGNVAVIDHINAFDDTNEVLGAIYRSLVPTAQEAKVTLFGISQQSNESLRWGTAKNMLATRGTGVGGMVVHFGFEVHNSLDYGRTVWTVDQQYLTYLKEKGLDDHKLKLGDAVKEAGLELKIVRRGKPTRFYGTFEPTSGRMVDLRSDYEAPSDPYWGSKTGWDWDQEDDDAPKKKPAGKKKAT